MKEKIIASALDLASDIGVSKVTRHAIARRSGASYGTVFNVLGDMPATKEAIIQAAVDSGNLHVIAEGIMMRSPSALAAPSELKQRALSSLA